MWRLCFFQGTLIWMLLDSTHTYCQFMNDIGLICSPDISLDCIWKIPAFTKNLYIIMLATICSCSVSNMIVQARILMLTIFRTQPVDTWFQHACRWVPIQIRIEYRRIGEWMHENSCTRMHELRLNLHWMQKDAQTCLSPWSFQSMWWDNRSKAA